MAVKAVSELRPGTLTLVGPTGHKAISIIFAIDSEPPYEWSRLGWLRHDCIAIIPYQQATRVALGTTLSINDDDVLMKL